MTAKITIDKAGRVVLPKHVREELQLEPGDTLELQSSSDYVTLRPARGGARLQKERGVWVYETGSPLSTSTVQAALEETRGDRLRRITREEL